MKKSVLLITALLMIFGFFSGENCRADVIYQSGYNKSIKDGDVEKSISVYVFTDESTESERKENPRKIGQYIYTGDNKRKDVTGFSWGEIFKVGKKMYRIKEKGLILQKVSINPDPGDRVVLYTFDFYYQ